MTWLIAQILNKSPILQQASPSGTPPLSLLPADVGGHCGWEDRRFSNFIVQLVARGLDPQAAVSLKCVYVVGWAFCGQCLVGIGATQLMGQLAQPQNPSGLITAAEHIKPPERVALRLIDLAPIVIQLSGETFSLRKAWMGVWSVAFEGVGMECYLLIVGTASSASGGAAPSFTGGPIHPSHTPKMLDAECLFGPGTCLPLLDHSGLQLIEEKNARVHLINTSEIAFSPAFTVPPTQKQALTHTHTHTNTPSTTSVRCSGAS
ncbi:hypothetical protein Q8A73_006767 [Channa argus]|nr:hypothetical protein Q8A73_006767 [Channa argus]